MRSASIPALTTFAVALAWVTVVHGAEPLDPALQAQQDTALWTFWLVLATGGQALVGAVGLVVLFITLRQNRNALLQAARSADIGEQQTRAYVGIENAHANQVTEGQPLSARFVVSNSGQSTAHNVRVIWAVVGRLIGEDEPFPDVNALAAGTPAGSTSVLSPGGRLVINARKSDAATRDVVEALASGTATVYFFGKISYDDIFGKSRSTYFKYRKGGGVAESDMTMCEDGNSAS